MTKQYVVIIILKDKIKSSTLVCQEPMMGSCVCPLKKVVHFNARDEWRDQVFEIQTELRKNLPVTRDKNRKIAFPALQTSCQQMSYCRKKIMANRLQHVLKKMIITITRSLPAVLSHDYLASPQDVWSVYLHD